MLNSNYDYCEGASLQEYFFIIIFPTKPPNPFISSDLEISLVSRFLGFFAKWLHYC